MSCDMKKVRKVSRTPMQLGMEVLRGKEGSLGHRLLVASIG